MKPELQAALGLVQFSIGDAGMTAYQKAQAGAALSIIAEALGERDALRAKLNPYTDHSGGPWLPEGQPADFIRGIRYYAGMLEDDDNWSHSLGHIESLCAEFQTAIDKRAGREPAPPVSQELHDAELRIHIDLPGKRAAKVARVPAPVVAVDEPHEIKVGSKWRSVAHKHIRTVTSISRNEVHWVDAGGYSDQWERSSFLAKHERVSDPTPETKEEANGD